MQACIFFLLLCTAGALKRSTTQKAAAFISSSCAGIAYLCVCGFTFLGEQLQAKFHVLFGNSVEWGQAIWQVVMRKRKEFVAYVD